MGERKLEDGPESAPTRIADVVFDHARTHPRSRVRSVGTRVRRLAPALVAAAAIVALTGGSIGALSFSRRSATPVAPVHVTGTQTCTNRVPGVTLYPQAGTEGSNEVRGRIDVCVESTQDERVVGDLTRKMDAWIDTESIWFGTIELHNAGGSWTGAIVASATGLDPTREGRTTWYAIGSGAYRGLAYRVTATTDATGHATVSGTIEGIGDDAIVANTWCWVDTADPDVSVTDPKHRVTTRSCLFTGTDDRIAGNAVETRTIDRAADLSTHDRGTLGLTTANGGMWNGSFSGSGDWGTPGEVSGTAEGAGPLAGQRLTFRIASEDGMHGILLGSIDAAP